MVPTPQDPSYSSSATAPLSHSEDLSAQDLHIIQQAASVLNCHVSQLLVLHNRNPHPLQYSNPSVPYLVPTKRPRFSSDMTAQSPQEKPSSSILPTQHDSERPHAPEVSNSGLSLGMDRSRLVQYMSNFAICSPCTTCEPQGLLPILATCVLTSGHTENDTDYTPIPANSPYTYVPPARQYFDDRPLSPGSVPVTISADHTNGFASSNGPSTAPPMMPNYPILQPNRPMIIQPSTSGEGMIYPEPLPNQQYFSQSNLPHGLPHGLPNSMPNHAMGNHNYGVSLPIQSGAAEEASPQEMDGIRGVNKLRELDIVQPNQRPPPVRRGPFKSNHVREQTAETRRIGSCIRCRMQRIRVSNPRPHFPVHSQSSVHGFIC